MPFVKIFVPPSEGIVAQEALANLHSFLLAAFSDPPKHVLRILVQEVAGVYPAPEQAIIEIRAQRRPDRTPEMLADLVTKLEAFLCEDEPCALMLKLSYVEYGEVIPIPGFKPIIRVELCDSEDVFDNYCYPGAIAAKPSYPPEEPADQAGCESVLAME